MILHDLVRALVGEGPELKVGVVPDEPLESDEAGDRGTGENVLGIIVEDTGVKDARVVITVSAWEADKIAILGHSSLASANTELGTA